jgi:flagellar basal-body rod protein FlgC
MGIVSAIAISGLNAADLRLQVAASNIANSLSDGSLPDTANPEGVPPAYSALRVNQSDVGGGGTRTTAIAASPATVQSYDPTAAFADANGFVSRPNIDLANEIVQLIIARYTFAANAQVIRANAQMSASLLNVTA